MRLGRGIGRKNFSVNHLARGVDKTVPPDHPKVRVLNFIPSTPILRC